MRRTVGLGGYAAVAFVSYVSFGVLTCSCSSFPVSLTPFLCLSLFLFLCLSLFLALSRPQLFACLLFHFFLFSPAVFISLFLYLSLFFSFDALRYPFFTSISLFSARSFFHYYISFLVQKHSRYV